MLKKSLQLIFLYAIFSCCIQQAMAIKNRQIEMIPAGSIIDAQLTYAPNVPPPINRVVPVVLRVNLTAEMKDVTIAPSQVYRSWVFNGHIPGPFIRARQLDTLEVHFTNKDKNNEHSIDFHAVSGPGGGSSILTAKPGETKVARFKLITPGLFMYHCATSSVPMHLGNGMFGAILVEPLSMAKADKEYYVVQNEFYTKETAGVDKNKLSEFSYENALNAKPQYITFNGQVGALQGKNAITAKTDELVRIYFINAGLNYISSFHVIGAIFDSVFKDGALTDLPLHGVQTTLVPAGGTSIVEFSPKAPGDYTLVDHALLHIDKGAIGTLTATGPLSARMGV
jgi:copper-containing nitrite reductase